MQQIKHLWPAAFLILTVALASCNVGKAPPPTTDANAVYTSVAGTMIAQMNDQLAQTSQAVAPTATPSPTELATLPPLPTLSVESTLTPFSTILAGSLTPLAIITPVGGTPAASAGGTGSTSSTAVGCADSVFYADITIPDGTTEKPGTAFTKIWRMKNTGTCKWGEGFKFAFAYGSRMGGGDFTFTREYDFVPTGGTKDLGIKLTAPSVPNAYTGCWKMQTDSGYWFGQAACVTIKVAK